MKEKWIVCKEKIGCAKDPRIAEPYMVVMCDSVDDISAFENWLQKNHLYAYKETYKKYFGKKVDTSTAIDFHARLKF